MTVKAKLLDPVTGKMQCKECGQIWFASIKPLSGGKFYRGSRICPKGCR